MSVDVHLSRFRLPLSGSRPRRLAAPILATAMLVGLVTASSPQSAEAQVFPAGQVHVDDGRFVVDGQPITLKGVNVDVADRLGRAAFEQVASWGMNSVRFRAHWTTLEPDPPVWNGVTWERNYDLVELERLKRRIRYAWENGIYSIIDNHDCDWCATDTGDPYWLALAEYNSKGITYDAANRPEWRLYHGDLWSDDLRQQHAREFLTWLAGELAGEPGIIGYEPMNEPQTTYLPIEAETTRVVSAVQRDWAQAIRAVDPYRVIFFQTRFGYLPGLPHAELDQWAAIGNVAADLHDGFGARWGEGVVVDPADEQYLEGLQLLNNNMNSPQSPPWAGTTIAKINHYLNRIEDLEPYGIPLLVGELGMDDYDNGAMAYWGSTMAALCQVGDHRISWSARDYSGPRGLLDRDGNPQPWLDLVVASANRTCDGSVPEPPDTAPPTTRPPATTVPPTTTTTTEPFTERVFPAPSPVQPSLTIKQLPGRLVVTIGDVDGASSYQLRYSAGAGYKWLLPSSVQVWNLTDLDPAITYTIQARALVGASWRPWTVGFGQPLEAPVEPARALLLVKRTPLNNADQIFADRLEAAGVEVVAVAEDFAPWQDPDEYDLVLVSTTLSATAEECAYETTTTPVIVWEGYLMDDLGMGRSGETSGRYTWVTITDPAHRLAAGLSGSPQVYTARNRMSYAVVGGDVEVIAHRPNNSRQAVVFHYPQRSTLADGTTAIGARYGLFPDFFGSEDLNANGIALIDATIAHALGR